MKRILGIAVAAVLAAGAGLVAPTVATAVPSNVVTSSEFYKVTQGNSLDYVRSTFGNQGKVLGLSNPPGTANDYVSVEFPTYYDGGFVIVDFAKRSSGAWYLVTKYAYWGNAATRTADKATQAEFNRVKQGNSIAYVRSTFGTNGTITEYFDAPGNVDDVVVVEWPTASTDGWLQVLFTKSSSGVWKLHTRSAYWGLAGPTQTKDKATESEFNKVKAGQSIDSVRSTFGTSGTIDLYHDAPGTAEDEVWLLWPTDSPEGVVEVDFVKSSTGGWKAGSRWAYWDRTAKPTEDLATQDEFRTLADGDTISDARATFGTSGTVVSYWDGPGNDGDMVQVAWYTGPDSGDVFITFVRPAGVWTIESPEDLWGPWSGSVALRSKSSEASGSVEPPAPTTPSEKDAPARPSWDLRDAG